jgi:hypothetical protein
MKVISPPSYTKVFAITPTDSTATVVGTHRGLLVTTTTVTTLSFVLQDGSAQTVANIPANTVFILPLIVKFVKQTGASGSYNIYGLL